MNETGGSREEIRCVSPEEARLLKLLALKKGRGDVASQEAWDLAVEEAVGWLRDQDRYLDDGWCLMYADGLQEHLGR